MKKFWKWENRTITDEEGKEKKENTLFLNGTIAEESWYDDDITPKIFKEELLNASGDIVVWINSPGGDCIAAAQIYNMLMEYPHNITVKIDGMAASAATVIAMAADKVCVSPVSMFMIHNPSTFAAGDSAEMKKAIALLDEVKESIMNAYERKTGLARSKISHLMDKETWMNANKAIELGFADEILERTENIGQPNIAMAYSQTTVTNMLKEKIAAKAKIPKPIADGEVEVASLYERLEQIKDNNI